MRQSEYSASEPIGVVAAIVAAVASAITLVVAFGLDIEEDQRDAILSFIPAIWSVGALIWGIARREVTPVAKARAVASDAHSADSARPTELTQILNDAGYNH